MALAFASTLTACSSLAVDGRSIDGTWRAVSVAGQAPIAGSEPTIRFEADRMHVFGGCNSRVSEEPAIVRDARLVVPPMLDTAVYCLTDGGTKESPVMPIEATFITTLTQNSRIELVGHELRITGPQGVLVLVRS